MPDTPESPGLQPPPPAHPPKKEGCTTLHEWDDTGISSRCGARKLKDQPV
jgi:hypothetical protein